MLENDNAAVIPIFLYLTGDHMQKRLL